MDLFKKINFILHSMKFYCIQKVICFEIKSWGEKKKFFLLKTKE